MPSENLDLVRSIHAAWERGNFSSTDWADPDIEFVVADGPDPHSWSGLSAMAEGWRDFLNAWEGYRVQAQEYREIDSEHVLVLGQNSGRGRPADWSWATCGREPRTCSRSALAG